MKARPPHTRGTRFLGIRPGGAGQRVMSIRNQGLKGAES